MISFILNLFKEKEVTECRCCGKASFNGKYFGAAFIGYGFCGKCFSEIMKKC